MPSTHHPAGSPLAPSSLPRPRPYLASNTGDLIGSFAQAGGSTRTADGTMYANTTLVFTATIPRCGIGTVAMSSTGFNRADNTSGEITIVEGSGTGENWRESQATAKSSTDKDVSG